MGLVRAIAKETYSARKRSYSKLGEDEEVPQEAVFTT